MSINDAVLINNRFIISLFIQYVHYRAADRGKVIGYVRYLIWICNL